MVLILSTRTGTLLLNERERGIGASKRKWASEMNDARQLYLPYYTTLAVYGRIDTIDSLIKRCHIYYRSWKKYWHSPKNHGLALALVVAYDMYKEIMSAAVLVELWQLTPEHVSVCSRFHRVPRQAWEQSLLFSPTRTEVRRLHCF
jgi:hypothetical protein